MHRGEFIRNTAAVIGGSLLVPAVGAEELTKKASLRFAFISDIHIQSGIGAEAGMSKALHSVQSLKPKVDFIINGGDSIMDSLETDKATTAAQWELFHSVLKNENSLPIYHCIGNHDVWGWMVRENKPEADKLYGKQWAVEVQQLPRRYYSFSKNNWHFIVLDSTQLNPAGGYIAQVDPEQLAWLKQELADHRDKFVCIVSHIPILSICAGLFFNKMEANGDLRTFRFLMHTDFFELKNLFMTHPNIRACLSGHIHMQDELEYLGIKYYCNGAVSGNWWKGPFHDFAPAYAVFEFKNDGTTSRHMINYNA